MYVSIFLITSFYLTNSSYQVSTTLLILSKKCMYMYVCMYLLVDGQGRTEKWFGGGAPILSAPEVAPTLSAPSH